MIHELRRLRAARPTIRCDACKVSFSGPTHAEAFALAVNFHENRPDRQRPVCDFCLSENPKWEFPTGRIETPGMWMNGRLAFGSSDNWACCDVCKDLVERNRRHELAARAMAGVRFRDGSQLTERERLDGMGRMMDLMGHFFLAKLGPAQPFK